MSADESSAVDPDRRVSPLELFFDLVFVFAITQVTAFLAHELTWENAAKGVAILLVLWWAWVAYAWVSNAAGTDDGPTRLVLLVAMAGMLVVSLAVPDAFGDDALWFAGGLFAVRILHLVLYWLITRDEPGLRGVVQRLALPLSIAPALLVVGALLEGDARLVCWVASLLIDYTGPLRGSGEGSRVHAGHFAERFALIIIIALGESIVSIGIGASGHPLDASLVAASLLAISLAGAMWWAYFDLVAIAAERRLHRAEGLERVRLARDSYMYLHTPMVVGIVLFALGVKQTIAYGGEPLGAVSGVALCGGVATYLLAHVAFRLRNMGTWNVQRVVVALSVLALLAIRTQVDAIVLLACVAALVVALVVYETIAFAEGRRALRGA